MSKLIRPAFKCHGGKFYLSSWIISHFPENYQQYSYIEPFCGGANILINKEKSPLEIVCDQDVTICQVFRAIRDEPKEFHRRLALVKYCQETFDRAVTRESGPFEDYLEHAVNEYTLRRMSRNGLRKAFAWSERLRGGIPEEVNSWKSALELLPVIGERFREVYIFNKPGIEVVKTFNNKNVLVYADPPHLHDTAKDSNEMDMDAHVDLSRVLNTFKGKVVLSGYSSPLYGRLYKDWKCEKKKTREGKSELLWKNF